MFFRAWNRADSNVSVNEVLVENAKAFASWKVGRQSYRKLLAEGRYTIGATHLADIEIGGGIEAFCARLEISGRQATLRCLRANPVMFLEGRKLKPGETIVVGDVLEVTIGRVALTISVGAVAAAPDHLQDRDRSRSMRKSENEQNASANPLQASVESSFLEPDRLRLTLSRKLLDQLNLQEVDLKIIDSPETREKARLKLRKMVGSLTFPTGYPFSHEEIENQVFDEVMGLGPLEPLLADSRVTEIMVNRRDQIFVERDGKLFVSPVYFSSDHALLNVIERIVSQVGRRIDTSSPIVDARLLDGSRVNAVIPPLALKGPCLTIRRFSKTPICVEQLIEWGSLNQEMADFLRHIVSEHKNILISGGTGSGKTTLLGALSSFIPDNERIVTVEDAAELQLQQEHVISLESRPANLEGAGSVSIRDLVKNTLRMRPDRIIVGECRGAEALDMLQAMNTGHDGSMTTAHANSPEDMLRRLETMVMMAGMDLPLRAIREQICSALTLVVQQTRRKDGFRCVNEIAWIKPLDRGSGEYVVVSLFKRDMRTKKLSINVADIRSFWRDEEIGSKPEEILGRAFAEKAVGRKSP